MRTVKIDKTRFSDYKTLHLYVKKRGGEIVIFCYPKLTNFNFVTEFPCCSACLVKTMCVTISEQRSVWGKNKRFSHRVRKPCRTFKNYMCKILDRCYYHQSDVLSSKADYYRIAYFKDKGMEWVPKG